MTAPVWPSSDLPTPLFEGYSTQSGDMRLKRQVESGPPGYRRRFSVNLKTVNLSIDVTVTQMLIFDYFFETTLHVGTLPFWMADPILDGAGLEDGDDPIIDSNANEIAITVNRLYVFGNDMPRTTPFVIGGKYKIDFSLVQMPT